MTPSHPVGRRILPLAVLVGALVAGGCGQQPSPTGGPTGSSATSMASRPVPGPSRLGAIDGDLCGFPKGRRLLDDVTDMELRALVEGYGRTLNAVLGVPNRTPNNLLGDGVDENDGPFLAIFPYIGTPNQGYEHSHHRAGPTPI